MIETTLHTDPGCPWGYSATPALSVLRWRYRAALDWRLVVIGLAEDPALYEQRGYTATRMAAGQLAFRRYGMPLGAAPRARVSATAPACRALIAVRLLSPGREWAALRALQFAWFTTALLPDEPAEIEIALRGVPGIDPGEVVAHLDDPQVLARYEQDRQEARSAAGSPTEFQGKAAVSDGVVRYTAPSLILSDGDRRLEAGGFQPVEAYDVLVANLDPTLERTPPPEDPLDALRAFPEGLVTQEVAAILAQGNEGPDRGAAEAKLIEHTGAGRVRRQAMGDDALWIAV